MKFRSTRVSKLDEWQGKLPEFNALVGGLTDLDPNSEDAQEIGSIILKLDEFCISNRPCS